MDENTESIYGEKLKPRKSANPNDTAAPKSSETEGKTELKVVYDKKMCIGAGPCYAYHPEMWGQDEDFKATLKDGEKHKSRQVSEHVWERDIEESELEKAKDSAVICPVDAIWVERNRKKVE